MERFGSHKFRMGWAGVCLVFTGLFFAGICSTGSVGGRFIIFGTEIPLGFDNPKPYIIEGLGRVVYTVVSAIILLGGFIQLNDLLMTGGLVGRCKGFIVGSVTAFLHGALLSQLAILPVLAASYRLLGSPFVLSVVMADVNAMILGLQLLLWTAALGLIIKSNRGLTIFFVYSLSEIGRVMTWGGEFLGDLGVNKILTNVMTIIGQALPSSQLPSDPTVWSTLYISLGAPSLSTILLLLFFSKTSKRSRA